MKPATRWTILLIVGCLIGGLALMQISPTAGEDANSVFWLATVILALLAVQSIRRMAAMDSGRVYGTLTAALFGVWVICADGFEGGPDWLDAGFGYGFLRGCRH